MDDYKEVLNLKGGSFSSTKVLKSLTNKRIVRKSISIKDNREYGLVRWQSQIRRMQLLRTLIPNNVPPIIKLGVDRDNFYYDIPYYESSQNLYEYLLENGKDEAKKIFDKVFELIEIYSQAEYGPVKGSFSVFFAEEVAGRLINANEQIELANISGSISDNEMAQVKAFITQMMPILNNIIDNMANVSLNESLTHGNLTLENALYLHDLDTVILIDPYSETYSESLLGDLSQLMQSSLSFYEEVVSSGEENIKDLFHTYEIQQKTGVSYFGELLELHISSFHRKNLDLIYYFYGAQFIRMFPFKIQSTPRLATYFLLHGLNIIKETFSNVKH